MPVLTKGGFFRCFMCDHDLCYICGGDAEDEVSTTPPAIDVRMLFHKPSQAKYTNPGFDTTGGA